MSGEGQRREATAGAVTSSAYTEELRVSVHAETLSDAVCRAEVQVRQEGYEPQWASLSKQHHKGGWLAMVAATRKVASPEALPTGQREPLTTEGKS